MINRQQKEKVVHKMGLFGFGKPKDDRKKLEKKINKLMKDYGDEKISGDTYSKKMMNLITSYQKKNKK